MEITPDVVQQISTRLRQCNTATIYDVLDKLGYPNQCLDLAIKPLDPGMRIAGPAFTIHDYPR